MTERNRLNIQEIKNYILAADDDTKFYIGGDSERFKIDGVWYADYATVIIAHINGNRGCKVFGEVVRERDFDKNKSKPRYRLMNEVYKISELYMQLHDVLEDRDVEIHLDINPNKEYGSSVVISEAIGYIKGTCNMAPKVKPDAFCASAVADRFKSIMSNRKKQADVTV